MAEAAHPTSGPGAARAGTGRSGERAYVALLGLRTQDARALQRQVLRGLPYRALERFRRHAGLSLADLSDLIQMNERTLSRRKQEGRLQPDESDRLLRATRVLGGTIELFEGDEEAAREWLATAQPALGGDTPLAFMRTDIGTREVERLIGRLEHGVFS